jgi:hypothetical protein
MAQISTSLSAAELDSAINWRFSLENLCAANDWITRFMAAMIIRPMAGRQRLPSIYGIMYRRGVSVRSMRRRPIAAFGRESVAG